MVLILVLLPGCGGGNASATIDELPLAPGLTMYEGAQEIVLDNTLVAAESAFDVDASGVEVRYFLLPEGATGEEVLRFYREAMAADGWGIDEERSGGGLARWSREGTGGKQVFVVSTVPAGGDVRILLAILASS
jgi:hypothetical protein